MMKRRITITVTFLGLAATMGFGRAEAGIVLTAEAAGVDSSKSNSADLKTENFNSYTPGIYNSLTTNVGTLTSASGFAIVRADQYGGSGGTGNYFAVGAESRSTSATLMLNGPETYFGLWWSAADALNSMELLSNGQVVASFDSASALGALDSSYYGNPNANLKGQDSNEPFAYLNFIATGDTTFNEVIFNNVNTSTGFEADNFSVSNSTGSGFSGNSIPGLAVPGPSSLAMTLMGVACLGAFAGLRKRRAARLAGLASAWPGTSIWTLTLALIRGVTAPESRLGHQ